MLSKNRIKLIRSLEHRKYRLEHGCFVAEGPKVVCDLLPKFHCRYACGTEDWLLSHRDSLRGVETDVVTADELRKVSFMEHPQQVLALFDLPSKQQSDSRDNKAGQEAADYEELSVRLVLALDNVQNPGNVGTILRIADWFGISDVVCSRGTADVYSPKVVQATMGSLARVRVHEVDLPVFLSALPTDVPVYGTFLDGENVYEKELQGRGVIVMGNEGNGISTEVGRYVTDRITIPNFNSSDPGADSLNVGVATAVVCSEFRRRGYIKKNVKTAEPSTNTAFDK